MEDYISNAFSAHAKVYNQIVEDKKIKTQILTAVRIIVNAYSNNKKVLFCGNGGSAADSQHLASELSGRFLKKRKPLFAEALHVNSSYLTAVANDYDYSQVFERAIEAKGKKGDVLISLTTSGQSKNIVKALKRAKKQKLHCITLTGHHTKEVKKDTDVLISIPSDEVPRIQEMHILVGHIICGMVEDILFP